MPDKRQDLCGHRFGKLIVVKFSGLSSQGEQGQRVWECRCECGRPKYVKTRDLNSGNTTHCGCSPHALRHGHARHHKKSRTYSSWRNMIARCYQKSARNYKHYGGRGVTVCDRWLASFEVFLADMGECGSNQSIERVDTNGNYEKRNCIWANQFTQCNNMRNNVRLTFGGKRQSVSAWSRELNINKSTIYHRLKRGWTAAEALSA